MAVAPVSLGPSLRAWSLAGITHILCDGEIDPVFLGEGAPVSDSASQTSGRPTGRSPVQSSPLSGDPGTARPPAAAFPAMPPQKPAPAPPGGATDSSAAQAIPVALAFAPGERMASGPAVWPGPWADWFAKIAPAPVLWTYHELGADLTGIGRSSERSAFFKNLIAELRLPKGSSVFWPSAMPAAEGENEARLTADSAVFATGLRRLTPQIVVAFGENTLADIGLAGKVQSLRQAMVEGKLLLCLPEIDTLLRDGEQRARALPLLRAVLYSVTFS